MKRLGLGLDILMLQTQGHKDKDSAQANARKRYIIDKILFGKYTCTIMVARYHNESSIV